MRWRMRMVRLQKVNHGLLAVNHGWGVTEGE
jgi:hypothetical protein